MGTSEARLTGHVASCIILEARPTFQAYPPTPHRRLDIHLLRLFLLAVHAERTANPGRVDQVVEFGLVALGWIRMLKPRGPSHARDQRGEKPDLAS